MPTTENAYTLLKMKLRNKKKKSKYFIIYFNYDSF